MEVRFHLPGLHRNGPINMMVLGLLQTKPQYFREGVAIGSFYGAFPYTLWNGGRGIKGDTICSLEQVRSIIDNANKFGVPVRFTYTNLVLEEEDLKDPLCNCYLKFAENGMNGVILVSPLLEAYIRKNYPKMRITSSTCKELRTVEAINRELKKDYDMVVLDYNMNNRFDLLAQIEDRKRCEILVNPACIPNCQRRGEHYRTISENQKIQVENMKRPKDKQLPYKPWECYLVCSTSQNVHTIRNYCTYVSPEDIWEKYVPMGFKNFKIEGRTDDIFVVIEAICHYLVKPEYQGEVRLMILGQLERMNMIKVYDPQYTSAKPANP